MEKIKLKDIIIEQITDDKAENIEVFSPQNDITSYIIIATARSTKHLSSISEKLVDNLKRSVDSVHAEGTYQNSEWILVDFGEIILHLFTDEQRKYFNLEELYKKL